MDYAISDEEFEEEELNKYILVYDQISREEEDEFENCYFYLVYVRKWSDEKIDQFFTWFLYKILLFMKYPIVDEPKDEESKIISQEDESEFKDFVDHKQWSDWKIDLFSFWFYQISLKERFEFKKYYIQLVFSQSCLQRPWVPKHWSSEKIDRFYSWYNPIFYERIKMCRGHSMEKYYCTMVCRECGNGYCHCFFPDEKHCCCITMFPF